MAYVRPPLANSPLVMALPRSIPQTATSGNTQRNAKLRQPCMCCSIPLTTTARMCKGGHTCALLYECMRKAYNIYIYKHIHIWKYTSTCSCTCSYTYTYRCTYIYTYVYICKYIPTGLNVVPFWQYIQIYIYIYIL